VTCGANWNNRLEKKDSLLMSAAMVNVFVGDEEDGMSIQRAARL
jgi:hypothetical protein